MRAMPCRISGHRADAPPSRPPCTTKKKGKPKLPLQIWSGKRDLNPRSNSLKTQDFSLVLRCRCAELCTKSKGLATSAKPQILHQTKKRYGVLLGPEDQSLRERFGQNSAHAPTSMKPLTPSSQLSAS